MQLHLPPGIALAKVRHAAAEEQLAIVVLQEGLDLRHVRIRRGRVTSFDTKPHDLSVCKFKLEIQSEGSSRDGGLP